MLADMKSDLLSGAVVVIAVRWPQVHSAAERLSELYTHTNGHRSINILHVATAIELGAKEFLKFDENQKRLAAAEGILVSTLLNLGSSLP
jgi:predicted nucleic acid-binding protein